MGKAWECIFDRIMTFNFEKGLHSFVNPYSLLLLENSPDLCNKIDFWMVDGISLVRKLNNKFEMCCIRCSFDDTSLAPLVFDYAKRMNLKIAIIGTRENLIDLAIKNIEKKFLIEVDYFRNGYFNSKNEIIDCYNYLIRNDIELVICGMGTPYQEEFLIGLKELGWFGYGFTCGGYLHQIAKEVNYYPNFFDKFDIRWIYRIYDEPRLLKRYLFYYPLFFIKLDKFMRNFNKCVAK